MTAAATSSGSGIEGQAGVLNLFTSHVAALGDMRSSAFLFATMISGVLFKFGDSALSRLAEKGNQQAGAVAAQTTVSGVSGAGQVFAATTTGAAAKAALMSADAWENKARGDVGYDLGKASIGNGALRAAAGPDNLMATKEQQGNVEQIKKAAEAANMSNLAARGTGINTASRATAEVNTIGGDGTDAARMTAHNLKKSRGTVDGEIAAVGGPGNVESGFRQNTEVKTRGDFGATQQLADATGGNAQAGAMLANNSARNAVQTSANQDLLAKRLGAENIRDYKTGYEQKIAPANQVAGNDVGDGWGAAGAYKATPDSNGGKSLEGMATTREQQEALRGLMAKGGASKDSLKALDNAMNRGQAFAYTASVDKAGRIAQFRGTGGTSVDHRDGGRQETGNSTKVDNSYKNDSSRITDASVKNLADNIFSRKGIYESYAQKTYADEKTGEKVTEFGYTDNKGNFRSVLGMKESSKAGTGHSQEYFVNTRHGRVAVAGTQDGQLLMKGIDGNGAVNAVVNPATREAVFTDVKSGKTTSVHLDDTKVAQGTQVSGATNYAVGKIASTMGADQKTVEHWLGTVQSVAGDVAPVADAVSRAFANKKGPIPGTGDASGGASSPSCPGYTKW